MAAWRFMFEDMFGVALAKERTGSLVGGDVMVEGDGN